MLGKKKNLKKERERDMIYEKVLKSKETAVFQKV